MRIAIVTSRLCDSGDQLALRRFVCCEPNGPESRGYPCLFSVALDGHTIQRVTKSGLKAMKAEINQALKDSK